MHMQTERTEDFFQINSCPCITTIQYLCKDIGPHIEETELPQKGDNIIVVYQTWKSTQKT